MEQDIDFTVKQLGECRVDSPIPFSTVLGDSIVNFVRDDEFILYDIDKHPDDEAGKYQTKDLIQKAGPRKKIYFVPNHVHAGIVTCGGLCPGLNAVIRSIVRTLWYRYGVTRITGIKYGYKGFLPECNYETMQLNPQLVDHIHTRGGTVLGSSRGGSDINSIVDTIERMNLNILFTIGGDGTQSGARDIALEAEKRGLKLAIVGIPKTIDNDLSFIEKSFGFETAVSKAVEAVTSAHIEASDAVNGIGLVRLMGRQSGFIAAGTTLASGEVNFCLIPEVRFELEGENGLLESLKKRLQSRGHAVIVVAEGAGQSFLADSKRTDSSGNKKLGNIGIYLQEEINSYFKKEGMEANLKYIDPSYIIRSTPPNPNDSIYCERLGTNAVHAAMAGKTRILVSLYNNTFVHIPINMAIRTRNTVNPEGALWRDVLESTRQPLRMYDE